MYHTLETTNFIQNIDIQLVDYNYLKDCLKQCYSKCCFSTFPYFVDNLSSKESLEKYSSGNCITLSLCLQNILKKKNIISYLIPATIPNMYKKSQYLDISHVALAVPLNKNEIFILDAAFYFIEPILVNLQTKYKTYIRSSKIYGDNISLLECSLNFLTESVKYNQYQIIPKDTYICKCNYLNDKTDDWIYILREIINPDQAITTFFINIIKYPHITTTYFNDKGECKMDIYIKMLNNDEIKISKQNIQLYRGLIEDIPFELLNYINPFIKKYFNKHITYVLDTLKKINLDTFEYSI